MTLAVSGGPGTVPENFRMDNLQAAFARSQLRRLDETVAHRQSNCEHLAARLREVPGIEVMPVPEYTMHD